jgi:hypothetical protein
MPDRGTAAAAGLDPRNSTSDGWFRGPGGCDRNPQSTTVWLCSRRNCAT